MRSVKGSSIPWRVALLLLAAPLAAGMPGVVAAQNTGGVYGPVVTEGHRALEYRSALDPDSDSFAHRIHYQRSLDDSRMWRVVAQSRHPDGGSARFDYLQAELFWQLADISEDWQTGLRFDVLVRDGDRPGLFSFNWTNDLRINERLSARFLAMIQKELGENASDSLILQTRARLRYVIDGESGAGIEMFNAYGPLAELSGFDNQSHQLGPFYDMRLAEGWQLFGSALLGASDASPDLDLRLWVTYSF